MVLVAWCSSEAALLHGHECGVSQVGTHPDMTLDVARMLKQQQTINHIYMLHMPLDENNYSEVD